MRGASACARGVEAIQAALGFDQHLVADQGQRQVGEALLENLKSESFTGFGQRIFP
jgi:hypothetical protein